MVRFSDEATLDAECIAFSKYLIRQEPNSYVLAKYREAHKASETLRHRQPNPFDKFLLQVSQAHLLMAKMVDSYTSFFSRSALVRKKMVLVLALLESSAPTYSYFDSIDPGGYSAFFLRMFRQGTVFIVSLCLGIVLIMPVHLAFGIVGGFAHLERRAVRLLRGPSSLLAPLKKESQDWAGPVELPPDAPTN